VKREREQPLNDNYKRATMTQLLTALLLIILSIAATTPTPLTTINTLLYQNVYWTTASVVSGSSSDKIGHRSDTPFVRVDSCQGCAFSLFYGYVFTE